MIKYLFIDVDGTLTDGKIYIGVGGELMKAFSVRDGHGIKHIQSSYGVIPVVLTKREESLIVKQRCEELGITECHQGVKDKLTVINLYQEVSSPQFFSYIGDDSNDLPAMDYIKRKGGIVASPADADISVKTISDYICKRDGGDGAVREFIDYLIANNLV